MDDAALRERIAEIEAKLKAIRFELAVKEAVLAELRACLPTRKNAPAPAGSPDHPAASTPGTFAGSLSARAASVLRNEGKALRASEIAKRIESDGFRPNGRTSTLALVISAMRRRKDLFTRVGRGRYTLAKQTAAGSSDALQEGAT